jgi:hypothetical protein
MAADKYLGLSSGIITNTSPAVTGGGTSANKILALDAGGLIDSTVVPPALLLPTLSAKGGAAGVTAGDLVYLTKPGADYLANKADNSAVATLAVGYVLTTAASGAAVTVYFGGVNTAVTVTTPFAPQYLDTGANAGKLTEAPPANPNYLQLAGTALTTTSLAFALSTPPVQA